MEVQVVSFCYTNTSGGTSLSSGSPFSVQYPRSTARVKIKRGFHDYETGWNFIGEPADPQLTAFLTLRASKVDRRVFVSEFELADRRDLGPLIDFVERGVDSGTASSIPESPSPSS